MIHIRRPENDQDALRPMERLALAVIIQAVKDARGDDEDKVSARDEARRWLAGDECRFYCQALDIDYVIIETFAYAGYPSPDEAYDLVDAFGFGTYRRSAEERGRNGS
jgi:hypothetical protein